MPRGGSKKGRHYWRAALTEAADLFSQGGDSWVPGMFHALRIAIQRLEQYGAQQEQLTPLKALQGDLDRANHGQEMRFVRPRKGHSSLAPDQLGRSGSFVAQQGLALVINELVFRSFGASRGARGPSEIAAAKILSRNGFTSRVGHSVTVNILRQWRVDAERGRPGLAEAREIFDRHMDGFPKELPRKQGIEMAKKLALHVSSGPWF